MYPDPCIHVSERPLIVYIHVHCTYTSVVEIVFESVQQKHLNKTLFDQQVMNFVWKNLPHKSV